MEGRPDAGLRIPAWSVYGLVLALGILLWWAATYHAATMPVWGPWEFSWAWYLTAAFSVLWYCRGLALTPRDARPALWRILFYFAGLALLYTVLQTHFEYLAEHMFFLNRVQHVVMHHLGPFLIALAWPGETLARGMPAPVLKFFQWRGWYYPMRVIQQPIISSVIFVGLVGLWLYPPIQFRAMVSPDLYQVMNWSMVVDGVLFWILVLDPRPHPPAPVSYGGRLGMAFFVMPPQILMGSLLAFTSTDIYPFYSWCGRIYPAIGPLQDQQIGGLNVWIPPSMMSIIAFVLIINYLRLEEDRRDALLSDDDKAGPGHAAAAWTGR